MTTLIKSRKAPAGAPPAEWQLRLYIAGPTPKSLTAFRNLKELCEAHLAGRYAIEVIDLLENPQLAQTDQVLAVPTVVRQLPAPVRKLIGTLANTERVLIGLDLHPSAAGLFTAPEGARHAA